MRAWNQRGEGRIGFIVTLAVLVFLGFLAVKIVPVRVNAYEFQEDLREEAKYSSVHRDYDAALERILERADALSIPIDAKNVDIRRTRSEVVISAHYQKPIDLKFTTYTYKFKTEVRAPLF